LNSFTVPPLIIMTIIHPCYFTIIYLFTLSLKFKPADTQ